MTNKNEYPFAGKEDFHIVHRYPGHGNDISRAFPGYVEPRLVSVDGLMQYLSCGKNKAYEIGAAAGALFQAGRKNLYDLRLIDRYIDMNTNANVTRLHIEERTEGINK